MKRVFLLCPLALVVGLSGCEKEQASACFTTSTTNPTVNQAVSFTNCSDNADEYEWNFGDGGTATGSAASHIYSLAGNYTVTLTASNDDNSDQLTQSITVTDDGGGGGDDCAVQHYGYVKVYNSHDSNYSVEINGTVVGNVGGYGTAGPFQYNSGTSVSVHIHQLDGYILYPSDFYGSGTVVECSEITVTPS